MAANEIDKLYVSQCISSDYCRGWNAAAEVANKTIERLENLLDYKCDRCIEREMRNGMKIALDEVERQLTFGDPKGVFVRECDIDKIREKLIDKR